MKQLLSQSSNVPTSATPPDRVCVCVCVRVCVCVHVCVPLRMRLRLRYQRGQTEVISVDTNVMLFLVHNASCAIWSQPLKRSGQLPFFKSPLWVLTTLNQSGEGIDPQIVILAAHTFCLYNLERTDSNCRSWCNCGEIHLEDGCKNKAQYAVFIFVFA